MSSLDIVGVIHTANTGYEQANQQNKEQLYQAAVKPTSDTEGLSSNLNEKPPSKEDLEEYVSTLNDIGKTKPPHLQFRIDDETGQSVVNMTDRETGELLRQIPGEEFLKIARMVKQGTESLSDHPGQWIELDA
jgi:flagellar protein FlaG